jgi:hypothetical protein
MARFELQGPDGKTYEVEAPSAAEAVAALSSLVSPSEAGGVTADPQAVSELGTQLRGLNMGAQEGATGGWVSEGAAGLGAVLGAMPRDPEDMSRGSTMFNYDVPFSERYAANYDQVDSRFNDAQEAAPGTYGLGQIAGGTALSATAAGALPKANTIRGQIAQLLGFGAAEGAIVGGGLAEGGPAERGEGALWGAGIGAGAGLLGAPAAAGLRATGRAIANPIRGLYGAVTGQGSEAVAGRAVGRAINRQDLDVDGLKAYLDQAAAEGQPMATIADALGSPGQRALAGATRLPGPGRTEAAEFLDTRQAGQADRVGSFLTDALETPDTARIRDAAMRRQRGEEASVNYTAAEDAANPVDVRGALGVIDERIGPLAGSGVDGGPLDALLTRYRARLAVPPRNLPEGTTAMELSDFSRVLDVKKDLADDIGAATRAGRANEVRLLTGIRDQLDRALEDASTGYRRANDTFRQQSQAIGAIDDGAAAARPMRTQDAVDSYQRLAPPAAQNPQNLPAVPSQNLPVVGGQSFPDAQAGFRTGFADPLMSRIENSPPGINSARQFLTPKNQAMMNEMATDPELFARQIGRENTMFETRRLATGGSQTADNIADQADMSGVDVGMIANLLAGRWGAAATDGARHVGAIATGKNEETRAMIARALLSNDPVAALAPALRRDMLDQNQQRILEALMRQGSLQGAEQAGYLR